ncbi:unnamed protein product, partial [Nesidiocoris tenuis]
MSGEKRKNIAEPTSSPSYNADTTVDRKRAAFVPYLKKKKFAIFIQSFFRFYELLLLRFVRAKESCRRKLREEDFLRNSMRSFCAEQRNQSLKVMAQSQHHRQTKPKTDNEQPQTPANITLDNCYLRAEQRFYNFAPLYQQKRNAEVVKSVSLDLILPRNKGRIR